MEIERTPVRGTVEVRVVYNIVEAASHESASALSALELSSTSISGPSSCNSAPQGPHTTISIFSPNLSDQSLGAAPADNASASANAQPPFSTRAQAMKSLYESIPHAMTLQQLKNSENSHQRDASRHKKRVRRLSKEMFMIVSMYALLQGVLFVAVAQTNAFTCEDWWGPAGIAGGVTVYAVCSVVDKLRRMGHHKRQVKRSEGCQSAVYDKIELLYACGSGCPIDGNLEPQISSVLPSSPALLCSRGLLVLGFLVVFSLLLIASCTAMLCHSIAL